MLPALKTTERRSRHFTGALALAVLLLGSAGCVYRMPVQQGNFLDPGLVEQLQVGMTRTQVSFLLGTPMIPSGFDADRWDYFYYVNYRRLKKPLTSRLTVYFAEDKVARIEREG